MGSPSRRIGSNAVRTALRAVAWCAGRTLTREPQTLPPAPHLLGWAKQAAGDIDESRLRCAVEKLSEPRNRLHSPEAMCRAEDALARAFAAAGLDVWRQAFIERDVIGHRDHEPFEKITYDRLDGVNVIARKPGQRAAAVVIVAHYDTVRDSPGADDNAAGVVALTELARILAPHRFRSTVVFAATDLEELGLFGAWRLVPALTADGPIELGINFESIAYTCTEPGSQRSPAGLVQLYPGQMRRIGRRSSRGDFTAVLYNTAARAAAAQFGGALAGLGPVPPVLLREPAGLPVLGPALRAKVPAVRNFARSDHVAFWERGLPALQVTDTADHRYPHYHRPTDTADRLDYPRLREVIVATAYLVAVQAGLVLTDGDYNP